MGLRSRGKYLILITIFGSFSLLVLQSRTGEIDGNFQTYESRLEELRNRLQSTERQNQARAVELHHLQQQLKRVAEAAANSSAARDASVDPIISQLNAAGTNTTNFLHLPSVLHYMPHLQKKPHGLRPALQLSQGNTGVSIVIGVPTIKREVETYLMETLHSLVNGLSQEEKLECLIVVFIAEVDKDYVMRESAKIEKEFREEVGSGLIEVISPPPEYYPDLNNLKETFGDTAERVKWRTKQNLDFSFLMLYCRMRGTYYVQLEDDIVAVPGYLTTMKNFAMQQSTKDWLLLEFSSLGFIGKLFKSSDLNMVVEFFLMFHMEKPIDWLLDHILYVKVCNPEKDPKHCQRQKAGFRIRYKPSLFQHIGLHSSLKGKLQKLKDRDFKKGMKLPSHTNPSAEVSSSIRHYLRYTLDKAYVGQDIFWGTTPTAGDQVKFHFTTPVVIEQYRFISGNTENPGDKFFNTTVEVLPSYHKEKKEGILEKGEDGGDPSLSRTEDGFIQVGKFEDGRAMGNIDEKIGAIQEMRLRVLSESKNWVILSEIHIVAKKSR
ncbi:alpha-1,3-mannosyl-glycoprotein 4-beta-N-acetylglucosaminyltransferase B-like [Diadema antillarum]|uniref:alpha-1,3-mannosyl-glycoprotein 4-beta-N-acetylglucosaminyltransferase B-like n=1 Tax=Diadema antillarum TaxID=105358 RepID=UPI003A8C7625